jgi:hypothetical protein
MRNATRVTVSAFGALAALAGLEHGIGEILQGNVAPNGLMILSWPESALFRILGGEPAMTIVPNLLGSGILTVFLSLIVLAWATIFVGRKNGGLVLILLSIVLLLVGGGFGPPMLGFIVGAAATRLHTRSTRWRLRRLLGDLWPWSLAGALIAWFLLCPGSMLLDHFFGVGNPELLIGVFFLSALGFLLLAIFAAFARDSQAQTDLPSSPPVVGGRPVSQAGS